MILSNDDLTVSTIEQKDMAFIQVLWGDEASMLASGGIYQVKEEDKEPLFQILNKGEDVNNHYIIKVDGEPVGDLSIRKFGETKTAHFDMKILHEKRNKGYGKKALKTVLKHFFEEMKGQEIYFEIWLVNYFAQNKLKDYGFDATLIMEDATIMTLTKEAYEGGLLNV